MKGCQHYYFYLKYERKSLNEIASQLQSGMSMQTEQTDIPSQKGKRKGAFSRPYSNRWHFQSFEAEPNRWNLEDEPTYRQYDYFKKSQWQPTLYDAISNIKINPSGIPIRLHANIKQNLVAVRSPWTAISSPRSTPVQVLSWSQSTQHQLQQEYNEPSGTQPRQQHPADRPSRYNGSSATCKCSRCSLDYCKFEKCRAIGHQCSILFSLLSLESACFNNPKSIFSKSKSFFYK